MHRALPSLLVLAGAAGCATPPPASISTPWGAVRAPDAETAVLTAEAFEGLRADLARILPDLTERGVDVWVQERPSAGPFLTPRRKMVDGFTLETFWRDRPRIHVALRNWGETLPHELVHALLGESWATLPAALEEGLADWASVELGANGRKDVVRLGDAVQVREWSYELDYRNPDDEREGRRVTWSGTFDRGDSTSELTLDQILRMRPRGYWQTLTDGDVSHIYGVGFLITELLVERVGIEGLHALCVEAGEEGLEQVPPDRILAAAGIEDGERFAAVARARRYTARLESLMQSEGFVDRVAEMLATCTDTDHASAAECLRLLRPEVRLDDGEPIPLEELPGFAAWLASREQRR